MFYKEELHEDKHSSLTNFQKVQRLVGLPRRYWDFSSDLLQNVKPIKIREVVNNKEVVIDEKKQKSLLTDMIKYPEMYNNPKVVCFSSTPNDDLALGCACIIGKNLLKQNSEGTTNIDIKYINVALSNKVIRLKKTPDLLVLHNITSHCDFQRLQIVKDYVSLYEDCFIIIVCAAKHPIDFCYRKLKINITRAVKFLSPYHKDAIEEEEEDFNTLEKKTKIKKSKFKRKMV